VKRRGGLYSEDLLDRGAAFSKCSLWCRNGHSLLIFFAAGTQYIPLPASPGLKQRLSDLHDALERSPAFQRLTMSGSLMNGRLIEI